MAVAERAVIGAPVVHQGIDIHERTFAGETRCEPVRRPSRVGAFFQDAVNFHRQIHQLTFSDLQHGTQSLHDIHAEHGGRHIGACAERGGESAAAEVTQSGR